MSRNLGSFLRYNCSLSARTAEQGLDELCSRRPKLPIVIESAHGKRGIAVTCHQIVGNSCYPIYLGYTR